MTNVCVCLQQPMLEKLKAAEEAQRVLQKDCETYKKVLAETVCQSGNSNWCYIMEFTAFYSTKKLFRGVLPISN